MHTHLKMSVLVLTSLGCMLLFIFQLVFILYVILDLANKGGHTHSFTTGIDALSKGNALTISPNDIGGDAPKILHSKRTHQWVHGTCTDMASFFGSKAICGKIDPSPEKIRVQNISRPKKFRPNNLASKMFGSKKCLVHFTDF